MEQLIINADSFGGIFAHKGERCVRIDDPFSGRRWIPVQDREVIVARQRQCSTAYVPAECLPEEFLRTLKDWQVWIGQTGGHFVWLRDLLAIGIRLVADWQTYVCNGADGVTRFTVPAGTVVIAGIVGNPHQAGHHWEVAA